MIRCSYRLYDQITHFKGHNAKFPCRFCLQPAVAKRDMNTGKRTYYPVVASDNPAPLEHYVHLPLREDEDTRNTAYLIQSCTNKEQREHMQGTTGINGEVSKGMNLIDK